jgi:nucleotide sugar dehydrogenase
MSITVVGLGKIGLPLAVQFASKDTMVFGADINEQTVNLVNQGLEPFPEEFNLKALLSTVVRNGKLAASTDTSNCVAKSKVVVVVVPLFVNDRAEPDFRAMDAATLDIAKGLQPGTLVCYETTLPVGTTRSRFTKALENNSGLKVGSDFHVAFSPERVLTGRVFEDLRKYPKIVGGITEKCALVAAQFYKSYLDFDSRPDLKKENGVWVLDSAESAEFVKLAETTYRDVNIGLANQFAKFADKLNLNIYDVIEASNSQTFSHIHQPGVAVGGHCIPIYPQFYLWGDSSATIVSAARQNNSQMPNYLVNKMLNKIGIIKEKKVLILGASYRANVKELAFSGVFDLVDLIKKQGADVEVFDPLYSGGELNEAGLPGLMSGLGEFEIVVIQTSATFFLDFLSSKDTFGKLKWIFDGRNLFEGKSPINGVSLYGIGSQDS